MDRAYGHEGKVTTKFGKGRTASFIASALAQPNGKVIAAGLGDGQMAFARYTTDGELDPSFGRGGKRRVVFADASSQVVGAALQGDGKLVAVGTYFDHAGGDSLALVRLRPNGSLDPSFGVGGRVITTLSNSVDGRGIALQPDGKIVVVGISDTGRHDRTDLVIVARYLPDGSLDTAFGQDGVTEIVSDGEPRGVAVVPDGGILVLTRGAVGRLLPNGQIDAQYGDSGWHAFADGDLHAMIAQPNGDVILAGDAVGRASACMFGLWRLLPSGESDRTFGQSGESKTLFPKRKTGEYRGLALQPNGRIVAVGATFATPCGADDAMAAARYIGA